VGSFGIGGADRKLCYTITSLGPMTVRAVVSSAGTGVTPAPGSSAIAALSVAMTRIAGVSRLRVIAAAIVRNERLLLVSKRAAPDLFYLPGGKPIPGESAEECLRRELCEELMTRVSALRLLAEVHAEAALEPVDLHMTVYGARLNGEPRAAAEIAELRWWPDCLPARLAPAVLHHVVPLLRADGLLPA
jgi:8-oxo-dGTP diphosphatase